MDALESKVNGMAKTAVAADAKPKVKAKAKKAREGRERERERECVCVHHSDLIRVRLYISLPYSVNPI